MNLVVAARIRSSSVGFVFRVLLWFYRAVWAGLFEWRNLDEEVVVGL